VSRLRETSCAIPRNRGNRRAGSHLGSLVNEDQRPVPYRIGIANTLHTVVRSALSEAQDRQGGPAFSLPRASCNQPRRCVIRLA
jgi:hypothetical protein